MPGLGSYRGFPLCQSLLSSSPVLSTKGSLTEQDLGLHLIQ